MNGYNKNSFNEILAEALRAQAMTPKPCPFCGYLPSIQHDSRWPRSGPHEGERVDAFEVVCLTEDCVIYHADNVYFLTKEDAGKAWNRRAEA